MITFVLVCVNKNYFIKGIVWFTAAVLNSSPRAPPLCIFRMLLLSLQMFVLFERKCPAKWTSQDIPPWFQFEANVYIPFKVCKTWIKIVYIYRGIWCHTRPCVKTLRSANPWMNVPKWSKLQRISPAQGEGSNGPCVGSISIGTQFITTWLSESGVLTKRDMQNMQSGGRGGGMHEDWNWEPLS